MEDVSLSVIESYLGPVLAGLFLISLALVIIGWSQLVRLAMRLERQRHGWSDDGVLRQFMAYRRQSVNEGGKRMTRYLREDVKVLADENGEDRTHRQAIGTLHLGYVGAIASGLSHILLIAMSEGIG